jgi:hypothetical protein
MAGSGGQIREFRHEDHIVDRTDRGSCSRRWWRLGGSKSGVQDRSSHLVRARLRPPTSRQGKNVGRPKRRPGRTESAATLGLILLRGFARQRWHRRAQSSLRFAKLILRACSCRRLGKKVVPRTIHVRGSRRSASNGHAPCSGARRRRTIPARTEPLVTRKREREDRPSPSRPNTACRASNSKRPALERRKPAAVAADRDCWPRCRSWCRQRDHQEGQRREHRRRPRAPKARPRSRMLSSGEWQVPCARSSPRIWMIGGECYASS